MSDDAQSERRRQTSDESTTLLGCIWRIPHVMSAWLVGTCSASADLRQQGPVRLFRVRSYLSAGAPTISNFKPVTISVDTVPFTYPTKPFRFQAKLSAASRVSAFCYLVRPVGQHVATIPIWRPTLVGNRQWSRSLALRPIPFTPAQALVLLLRWAVRELSPT
jgi:hypothetical protein